MDSGPLKTFSPVRVGSVTSVHMFTPGSLQHLTLKAWEEWNTGVELAWTPASQPGSCYWGCPAWGGTGVGTWGSGRGRETWGSLLFQVSEEKGAGDSVWGIAPSVSHCMLAVCVCVCYCMCMLSNKIQLARLFWAISVAHFLWCDCSGDRVALTTDLT